MLATYWSGVLGMEGKEMEVRQVSPRGGDLVVIWNKDRGKVALRGKACVVAKGEISFPI
jgi:diaminopimelate epimerase